MSGAPECLCSTTLATDRQERSCGAAFCTSQSHRACFCKLGRFWRSQGAILFDPSAVVCTAQVHHACHYTIAALKQLPYTHLRRTLPAGQFCSQRAVLCTAQMNYASNCLRGLPCSTQITASAPSLVVLKAKIVHLQMVAVKYCSQPKGTEPDCRAPRLFAISSSPYDAR